MTVGAPPSRVSMSIVRVHDRAFGVLARLIVCMFVLVLGVACGGDALEDMQDVSSDEEISVSSGHDSTGGGVSTGGAEISAAPQVQAAPEDECGAATDRVRAAGGTMVQRDRASRMHHRHRR